MFPEFPHYSSTLRSYFSLLTSETTVEFCWMTWQPLRRLVDSRKIAYLQICIYFIYNIYIYICICIIFMLYLFFPPTPRSRAFFQTYSPMEIGCLCAFRTLGVRFRASGGGGCFCSRFVHWMIHCMIYTPQACPTLRYILYTCPNL